MASDSRWQQEQPRPTKTSPDQRRWQQTAAGAAQTSAIKSDNLIKDLIATSPQARQFGLQYRGDMRVRGVFAERDGTGRIAQGLVTRGRRR